MKQSYNYPDIIVYRYGGMLDSGVHRVYHWRKRSVRHFLVRFARDSSHNGAQEYSEPAEE